MCWRAGYAKAACSTTAMRDLKCAEVLCAAAERDLLTVESMTSMAPIESVGFHLQQAAEKALKARLATLGETYPLTHNLATLMGLLSDRGVGTDAFESVAELTRYAVEFRYEAVADGGRQELTRAGAIVKALVADVRRLLDAPGPRP